MKSLARQVAQRRPLSVRQLSSTSSPCRGASASFKNFEKEKKRVREEISETKLKARSRVDTVSKGHDPKTRIRLDNGNQRSSRHGVFRSTVIHRFNDVLKNLIESDAKSGGIGKDEISRQAGLFMNIVDEAFALAERNITDRTKNSLFWNLREAFILRDLAGLTKEIQYSFQSFLMRQRSNKSIEQSHQKLLDFRFPHEWFPATRTHQRTIHAHVGPTNSGKTYNAIKALENSKRGVYAGPLRLLATEIFQRLNGKNYPCALLTGEEMRFPENTDRYFTSCTVEMTPLNIEYDVAVIDEIQMISDPDRGMSWTSALLGVQAKEVHVCGEERTVGIIQAICDSIGDKCIVHRYERLSPLETSESAINGDYNKLKKGDAIVAFSRLSLHALKRNIERETGKRCAIVYGSLPPEVRVQQAALFNDPDNDYDFIVASDAIGMGLNLEIRRVIMESVTKFDGTQNRLLTIPEIKQIGGRAGRYRTARTELSTEAEAEKVGIVTAMDYADLKNIKRAFKTQPKDIRKAVLHPPAAIVEKFASYFPPDTPLSFLLMRIKALANLNEMYELHVSSSDLEIADLLNDIPLQIYDRLTFLHVPASLNYEGAKEYLRSLARVVVENKRGDLLDIEGLQLEILDADIRDFPKESDYLYKLEGLHTALNMYLWLSYRYAGMFRDQDLAFHVRELVQEKLIKSLETLDFTEADLSMRRRRARWEAATRKMTKEVIGEGDLDDIEAADDLPPLGVENDAAEDQEGGENDLEVWQETDGVTSSTKHAGANRL